MPITTAFRVLVLSCDNPMSPSSFQACFRSWTEAVSEATKDEVIAVDGKTAGGSRDRKRARKALHMVSAWASTNRLVLAQEATEERNP